MDTYQKEDNIIFDSPKNQSSYIKVIGVGGGGNNAVNHMFRQGIAGVDFIVCNTDQKALNSSPVPNKIILGNGMGAGNNPKVAEDAAEAKVDAIKEAISDNTKMLFIAAGMGGGTGTGAAPVIAKVAKSIDLEDGYTKKILVVAIVTMPFSFEGRKRQKQALEGLQKIRESVDSVLVINNDKLLKKSMPLPAAYACADDVLLTAAKGISEIITVDSYINIDFEDVNSVMAGSGTALMGVGIGKGEHRAKDAIVMATTSELLNDNDICGAKDILLYISFSEKNVISTDELTEITDYITSLTGSDETNVIWGEGADDSLEDEIKITLIATGFERKKNQNDSNGSETKSQVQENPQQQQPVAEQTDEKEKGKIYPLDDDHASSRRDTLDRYGERVPGAIEIHAWPTQTDKCDNGMQLIRKEQPAVNILSNNDDLQSRNSDTHANEGNDTLTFLTSEQAQESEPIAATPIAEPTTEPVETARPSISREMQNTAEDRIAKIKRIHELLRNHPMGAEIVENIPTEELTGDAMPSFSPLSESDMPTSYLGRDGVIRRQDGYLDQCAD